MSVSSGSSEMITVLDFVLLDELGASEGELAQKVVYTAPRMTVL